MSTKSTLMETPAASHAIGDTTGARIPEKVINSAELLHLPDHGVFGNGHGLIYEKNSDQALQRPYGGWRYTPVILPRHHH